LFLASCLVCGGGSLWGMLAGCGFCVIVLIIQTLPTVSENALEGADEIGTTRGVSSQSHHERRCEKPYYRGEKRCEKWFEVALQG
jgi:hypothetical protein